MSLSRVRAEQGGSRASSIPPTPAPTPNPLLQVNHHMVPEQLVAGIKRIRADEGYIDSTSFPGMLYYDVAWSNFSKNVKETKATEVYCRAERDKKVPTSVEWCFFTQFRKMFNYFSIECRKVFWYIFFQKFWCEKGYCCKTVE